jgi:hypothetical protein
LRRGLELISALDKPRNKRWSNQFRRCNMHVKKDKKTVYKSKLLRSEAKLETLNR